MLQSMTGFGQAEKNHDAGSISITVKSVNSKNADINVKLPAVYREREVELRSKLADELQRGKIELQVFITANQGEKAYTINREVLEAYIRQLKEIAGDRKITDDNLLALASRMPNVMNQEEDESNEEEWNLISEGIGEAIEKMKAFRKQEGANLQADLEKRVVRILSLLEDIRPYESERIENVRQRLNAQMEKSEMAEKADRDRFEQELIYYFEKLDITEEKVRLKAHCDLFNEVMGQNESQGRKLNFVAQEMGREINTIGSKANHQDIQKIVVEMKDELEKIKEQLFNIL